MEFWPCEDVAVQTEAFLGLLLCLSVEDRAIPWEISFASKGRLLKNSFLASYP